MSKCETRKYVLLVNFLMAPSPRCSQGHREMKKMPSNNGA